jgi:hypothetical protein
MQKVTKADEADGGRIQNDTSEANTEREASGTGDTKAKVGEGRKREREAGAREGDSLRRNRAPGGDGRTNPFFGRWGRRGGEGGAAGGRELAAGGVQAKAQITQSHRWLAASCQCGHTQLPSL